MIRAELFEELLRDPGDSIRTNLLIHRIPFVNSSEVLTLCDSSRWIVPGGFRIVRGIGDRGEDLVVC